jgi:hypothetical protein
MGRDNAKVVLYFPLRNYVGNLLHTPSLAELLPWHASSCEEEAKAAGAPEGEAFWWDSRQGSAQLAARAKAPHSCDPRHLLLCLKADAFQPHDRADPYSCWAFMLECLNLPPHVRSTPGATMLMLLVPGTRIKGAKLCMEHVERIIDDDCDVGDTAGFRAYDASLPGRPLLTVYVKLTQMGFDSRCVPRAHGLRVASARTRSVGRCS